LDLDRPVVAHEVDPWSEYWKERSVSRHGPMRWYDLVQARRATVLEQQLADAGATLLVVNEGDADLLRCRTGGTVHAVANGAQTFSGSGSDVPEDPVVAFVGTLDYPPNVEAVGRLLDEVWPEVRRQVPTAHLLIAGRRPGKDLLERHGEGVEVLGEVGDVSDVFRRARASVYVGVTGRGTKNSVTESFVAGCPAVCSPASARGQEAGPHLIVGETSAELARHTVRLLTDDDAAHRAREACGAATAATRGWDQSVQEIVGLLRETARTRSVRR